MSLLRQAERCFKNQHVHKALNAFISPGTHDHSLQAVREADDRTSRGQCPQLLASMDSLLTPIRSCQIEPRREIDRSQRQHLHRRAGDDMRVEHSKWLQKSVPGHGGGEASSCRSSHSWDYESR